MSSHLRLTIAIALVLLIVARFSSGDDKDVSAKLARSNGSIPAVPRLPDNELTYDRIKRLLESADYIERYTGSTNLGRCSISGWKGTAEQADELTVLALADEFWATRYEAAKFAYSRGKTAKGITSALVAALDSEEPLVRGQVALAIGQAEAVEHALPRLKEMLATADEPLAVATVLATTEQGCEALRELAASQNATVRLFSNAGLIKAGRDLEVATTKAYLQDLFSALKSEDIATVLLACKSVQLASERAAGAGRKMAALLSHPDVDVRIAVSEAILQAAPKDDAVVAAIVEVLDDKAIQSKCIIALGRIGEKARPAIPALIKLMDHDRSARYVLVAYAFPGIDPQSPEVLVALLKVLKESIDAGWPDDKVIESIGGYGPSGKNAVPDLIRAMGVRTKAPYHVPVAIWALGQIGPDAVAAREDIEKYLSGEFRELAATALKRITAKDSSSMPAQQRRYPGAGVDY